MANKNIFGSKKSTPVVPPVDTRNNAGGVAYSRTAKEELANIVMTGFFGDTFYVDAEAQVDKVFQLAQQVDTKFLAQLTVEARVNGYMKDTPALLCAILTTRGDEGRAFLSKIFNRVIDNGKMLRNFVQIVRSGKVGRKSLGSAPKNLVRSWFESRDNETVFKNSIGNDPSLGDIIKMVHPKPGTPSREELFAYLIGKEKDAKHLPTVVKAYERFKKDSSTEVPDVPFEMLTALTLSPEAWKNIALNMSWTQLRMNLNTLLRHGCFSDSKIVDHVAKKLGDVDLIKKTKVFPYQIFTTIMFTEGAIPQKIVDALHNALDSSLDNIPSLEGKNVYVFPDVSGSMRSPVTGARGTASTKMRYVDVAGLIAAAFYRKGANIIAVDTSLHYLNGLNRRDSVATVATTLANFGGGGTNLSLPFAELNKKGISPDLIFVVSDNESWADRDYGSVFGAGYHGRSNQYTGMRAEFEKIVKRNSKAKLVCLDIAPTASKQSGEGKNILNVSGFSDRVFNVVGDFMEGKSGSGYWVQKIETTLI